MAEKVAMQASTNTNRNRFTVTPILYRARAIIKLQLAPDNFAHSRRVAMTALGLCSFVTLSASWTGSAYQLVAAVAAGAVFSGGGNPAAWAATMDVAGDLTAEVMGIMNMAGTLGALITPIVVGYMIENIEKTGGDWNQVIYLAAGIYLAASLSWLAVDPDVTVTNPRAAEHT